MKIFGWMNKKLHLGTAEYHRVAHRNSADVLVGEESGRKRGTVLAARAVKERDTEALLLPHVLLLTIGTFGHHSDPHQQQQQQIIREDQELAVISTDHEEDLKPASQQDSLIVAEAKPTATTALAAAFLHSGELTPKPAESSAGLEQSLEKVPEVVIIEEEIITSQEPLLKEDKEKIEKRTTLADLFAAETACAEGKSPDAAASADKQQTTTIPTKKKAKKTNKGEESPTSAAAATKKIRRLITRMLKKRIHPDQLARAGEERHARGGGGASDGGEERRRGLHYRLTRGC